MKFVFFDIECANYINDMFTICTFGYTITDEKFNVIKKEDFDSDYIENSIFENITFSKYYDYLEIKNCKFKKCNFKS